ncbi:MAG: glucosidase [Rhodothermales bacterium]|nr:glucosidase [Rhodothermales bacterium]
MSLSNTAEHRRLADSEARKADWKKWGPYVADRAWGTVREDYSPDGDAWNHFPHDHARSRAYRWNEDGLGGFCNRLQNVCLGVALWNERDPILKERLFGLSGKEGNHGEDVKEYYFYLDAVPSHAYGKMLYKYPQVAFPYRHLRQESRRRNRHQPEFELVDALGQAFQEGRYFDVFIEYAKAEQEDMLCRITAINRGPDPAPIHILPHIWFRNTWSWGTERPRPSLRDESTSAQCTIQATDRHLGERWWHVRAPGGEQPRLLFTENETNQERIFGTANRSPYVKDAFHDVVVRGQDDKANPEGVGTKAAAHMQGVVQPGESLTVEVRFTDTRKKKPFSGFESAFDKRKKEADKFFAAIQPARLSEDERRIQRQAFAGLLWSKQFYHYSVDLWLKGQHGIPGSEHRFRGRNRDWEHLHNLDVISMPDKWEYPWYAAWDLAFHGIPIAMIDPEWAKRQMILMTREWYMHPNGQLPAYEWSFSDSNPPVHAWASYRVYKIARDVTGKADTDFLEKIFHKMLLHFTWWVNRKDRFGLNVFQGGFLGLDNIGVFDRSKPLPTGGHLDQADGTSWMAMFCLNMLAISLELAQTRPAYEDVATKFFEHFVYIAEAINNACGLGGLWNEEDGFFYDALHMPDDSRIPLKIRSLVGLTPLFAVLPLDPEVLERLPRFKRRMEWFIKFRPHLIENLSLETEGGDNGRYLLSLVNRRQLSRILTRMLDSAQFLSDYGLRALSKEHEENPFTFHAGGQPETVRYEPAESSSPLFGGNSNWRGPIWFPVNFLMIESLQKFHHFYGEDFKVEMPSGSGKYMTLDQVATELSRRLIDIFARNETGERPVFGGAEIFQTDEHWRDHLLFYEYFHGDNGAGVGASHQTGWTALVAKLIQQSGGGSRSA